MTTRTEPPTAEEMLAYSRGELSAEEEARLQERLVQYPELVRTLTVPFPMEGAKPGDPDYMGDEEFAAHWAKVQERTAAGRRWAGRRDARAPRVWQWSTAAAAALAVTFGALLWQANARRSEPMVLSEPQVLFPDGRRGPGPREATPLTAEGDVVALVTPLIGQRDFERYRLELIDESQRAVWSSDTLRRREDDTFVILVPRRFLNPGTYQVVVYGTAGASEEKLASYSLRVPRP
jgi:hypothetical protein